MHSMIDDTPMRGPVLIANDVVSPREFAVLSGIAQCTYTKLASAIDTAVDRSFITNQNRCYEIGESLCLPRGR
jgi:hypothetical protein